MCSDRSGQVGSPGNQGGGQYEAGSCPGDLV